MTHVFTSEMERAFDSMQRAMQYTELSEGFRRMRQVKQQMRHQQRLATPGANRGRFSAEGVPALAGSRGRGLRFYPSAVPPRLAVLWLRLLWH